MGSLSRKGEVFQSNIIDETPMDLGYPRCSRYWGTISIYSEDPDQAQKKIDNFIDTYFPRTTLNYIVPDVKQPKKERFSGCCGSRPQEREVFVMRDEGKRVTLAINKRLLAFAMYLDSETELATDVGPIIASLLYSDLNQKIESVRPTGLRV